jgi:hypothetical protein
VLRENRELKKAMTVSKNPPIPPRCVSWAGPATGAVPPGVAWRGSSTIEVTGVGVCEPVIPAVPAPCVTRSAARVVSIVVTVGREVTAKVIIVVGEVVTMGC